MPKSLSTPKNPEFLLGTIAALRLLSGERQPANQVEQETLTRLRARGLKPEAVKRIIAAFDAKPAPDRQRLVELFVDERHALERMAGSAPTVPVVRDHRGDAPHGAASSDASGNVAVRDHRHASSEGAAGTASSSHAGHMEGTVGPLNDERMATDVPPGIRYTVRYKGLWCQEETDGLGSDEIYVITTGVAINKGDNVNIGALAHPVNTSDGYYGDVDSRNVRAGPVAVVYTGSPDTLSLAVTVMEHDYGDPDYYREEVNTFVEAAIAVASRWVPPVALLAFFKDNIVDAINWILGTGDDSLGTEVAIWERDALEALAILTPGPYLGTKRELVSISPPKYGPIEYIDTGLYQHFVTKHHGDGSEYVVCFDIERDPPRPGPIIL
jgi:hypothetical protein